MKGETKQRILNLLATAFFLFIVIGGAVWILVDLFGGGNDDSADDLPAAVGKRYNDKISYTFSFTSDEECPNGNIDDDFLHASLNFEKNKIYYTIFDFTISSFEINGWEEHFTSAVQLSSIETVEARLEEAATSTFTEAEVDDKKIITTTYSVPENLEEARTYRIVLRLTILREFDDVWLKIAFYGDGEDAARAKYAEAVFCAEFTQGLAYRINDDGLTCSVVGIGTATDSKIYIPSYTTLPDQDGEYPVTALGDRAFAGRIVTSIALPDSVTTIEWYSFYGCRKLTSIVIPDSVTAIRQYAFFGCSGLESIMIPNNVSLIGEQAFRDCINLCHVTFQDPNGWYVGNSKIPSNDLADSSRAALYLREKISLSEWRRRS